jgi:hypothetical protein
LPSLPLPLAGSGEGLSCDVGRRLAKGVANPSLVSLEDVGQQAAALYTATILDFIADLVGCQRICGIFLRQVLMKTWIFFIADFSVVNGSS